MHPRIRKFSDLVLKVLITSVCHLEREVKEHCLCLWNLPKKDSVTIRCVWFVSLSCGWVSYLPLTFEFTPWDPAHFSPWTSKPITTWCHGGLSLMFLSLISQSGVPRLSCLVDEAKWVCQGQLGLDWGGKESTWIMKELSNDYLNKNYATKPKHKQKTIKAVIRVSFHV